MNRPAIRTLDALRQLNPDEVLEGFLDGSAGEPEPGDNRSDSYWHGWRNGHNDRHRIADDDQRALARMIIAAQPPQAPEG